MKAAALALHQLSLGSTVRPALEEVGQGGRAMLLAVEKFLWARAKILTLAFFTYAALC